MTQQTENLHVRKVEPLPSPQELEAKYPISSHIAEHVMQGRETIRAIVAGKDPRFIAIVGPCSIHDPEGALDYAKKLVVLKKELGDRLFIVMRVYFEKPRTTIGWKGLINTPKINGPSDMNEGLRVARQLLLQINELGLHVATEFLDPIVPAYTAGLVTWAAIGARTTESQTHREMASGLSMPVGFKNGTDGSVQIAVDAMISARSPHSFLGIDADGRIGVVSTTGNSDGMLVLRGGNKGPNYDSDSVGNAIAALGKSKLSQALVIDCSHANCGKKHTRQKEVWTSIIQQRVEGATVIAGGMIESYLNEGNQPIPKNLADLKLGVSITDECSGWETTEDLLRWGYAQLSPKTKEAPVHEVIA
jgi:3-deoxy-7-phosphoheptulonate synthase